MVTCPVKNKAWQELEKEVGYFEAIRDYLENKRVRKPSTVKYKIFLRNLSYQKVLEREKPETLEGLYSTQTDFDTEKAAEEKMLEIKKSSNFDEALEYNIEKINNGFEDYYTLTVQLVPEAKEVFQQELFRAMEEETRANMQEDLMNRGGGGLEGYYRAVNVPEKETLTDTTSEEDALRIATDISERLGIEYQVVTAEEASLITERAKNKWDGEPAFFYGGKVYLVKNRFSKEMVVHEFAHPLVRWISLNEPSVIDRLYAELSFTEIGKDIIADVRRKYSELKDEDALFKEEVLVRAIERDAIEKLNNKQVEPGFAKFINNLFYRFKQLLRKIFGIKSDVTSFNSQTTISDLADMLLKGGSFEIDVNLVTDEDVVAYMKSHTEYINDFLNVDQKEVQAIINNFFDIASKHIEILESNKQYEKLAKILTDEYRQGDLNKIKSNLQAYQSSIANLVKKTKEDMDDVKNRCSAVVNSLFKLDVVMEKIILHMKDLSKNVDSREALHKAHYYNYLVDYWAKFIDEVKEALNNESSNVPVDSPLMELINRIDSRIKRINEYAQSMYIAGARDMLYDQLKLMSESIKKKYESIIDDLKKRGAPQSVIDRWYKEYHGLTQEELKEYENLSERKKRAVRLPKEDEARFATLQAKNAKGLDITPEKIELILKGKLGDINWFNSHLEGYLYNTDPVVGGLALYVKNSINEVLAKAQAKQNEFLMNMEPYFKNAGYNPYQLGKLGEDIGFKDIVGKKDEKGNIVQRVVWTFLNPFKNYRYEVAKLNDAVDKAHIKYAEEGTEEALKDLVKAISDRDKHNRLYMHQRYKKEYYKRQDILGDDEIGLKARAMRENILERVRLLIETNISTESNFIKISDQLDNLWLEYRQLHSLYYPNLQKKTGEDLEIALRLRAYKEATRDLYEWKLRPGAFENALHQYEQELLDEGIDPKSSEFKMRRDAWVQRNIKIVIKDEYYDYREELINRMDAILKKLPDNEAKKADMGEIYRKINELLYPYRDKDGQPNGLDMSAETIAEIKKLQDELERRKKSFLKITGLTQEETERESELFQIRKQRPFTKEEQKELNELRAKKNKLGLSEIDKATLFGVIKKLSDLSDTKATEYYVDVVNDFLTKVNTNVLNNIIGSRAIDQETAFAILNPDVANALISQDKEFEKWFKANHRLVKKYDSRTKISYDEYERVKAWTITEPKSNEYYETTTVTYLDGTSEVILGQPANRFWTLNVKPEFENERIIGKTIDNQGQWLPLTMEEGAADSRYINEKYFQLQKSNPALFKLLEKLKEEHLKNQEGLGVRYRLYYDYPRYLKSNLESLRAANAKEYSTRLAGRIRDFFRGSRDQSKNGLNYKEEFDLVRADMFDNEISSLPISGISDIDDNDVSTDIGHSMLRYMFGIEMHKKLVEINPLARAIQKIVEDPKNGPEEINKVNKFNYIHRGIITYRKKKGEYVRRNAVNNFISKTFEGKTNKGFGAENAFLNNLFRVLFSRASFSFFAFNIPSALKNAASAKFQGIIEASAGKYLNHRTLAMGEFWSLKAMADISAQLYDKKPKKLTVQMVELFDPSQGRFEEKFGESVSRTILKDLPTTGWFYNFRKWTELQATLQIFAGMMYHQKVKQTLPDGNVKEINYIDAWEVRDGKIQLKKGVDISWGITYDQNGDMLIGENFKMFKNRMQQVMNNLQGAYSEFDQPEAQRYLLFRFLSYLRRYFTPMLVNRFGFSGSLLNPRPRLNPGLYDVHQGYYITFLKLIYDTFRYMGSNLPYMRRDEKAAVLKVITEAGFLKLINIIMIYLLGWDADDEDRYEKLRSKSDSLPFLFTVDDPSRSFKLGGFLENHALFLLMSVQAENEQFFPFPGYGLDDYTNLLDLKSVVTGPTIDSYENLINDVVDLIEGDNRAFYSRNVGPYQWQQKGGSKFLAHLAKIFGLTGTSLDPVTAIKNFQSVQARAR